VIVVGVPASGLSVSEVTVLLNGRAGVEQRPYRSGTQARPVRLLPLSLLALSEQGAALRLCSASARSAEALIGAARPTAVQNGGGDVFARSTDHVEACAGSARGAWSPGIASSATFLWVLALWLSKARPERSCAEALSVAGT
jgi:hypothetical protein